MKKKMSVLLVLLMAVAITSYSVSGTYAKYTQTFTGSDSARVAKWLITANGKSQSEDFTFDLFANATNSTLADGVTPSEVIAPGSKGSFDIKVANQSEVKADVEVKFEVTNEAGIPLQYSIDNGATWSATLPSTLNTTAALNTGGEETFTVQWRWVYEVDDDQNVADTALGTAANVAEQKVIVNATVTATQVALEDSQPAGPSGSEGEEVENNGGEGSETTEDETV